jgi:hypothetical protein
VPSPESASKLRPQAGVRASALRVAPNVSIAILAVLGECDFHLSNLLVLQSCHRPRLRWRSKNIPVFKIEQTPLFEDFSLRDEERKVCCTADQFIYLTLNHDGE